MELQPLDRLTSCSVSSLPLPNLSVRLRLAGVWSCKALVPPTGAMWVVCASGRVARNKWCWEWYRMTLWPFRGLVESVVFPSHLFRRPESNSVDFLVIWPRPHLHSCYFALYLSLVLKGRPCFRAFGRRYHEGLRKSKRAGPQDPRGIPPWLRSHCTYIHSTAEGGNGICAPPRWNTLLHY